MIIINNKVIYVIGRGSSWGCETSRLPSLENLLTDGGVIVSLMSHEETGYEYLH
jgi:hypothetical protein